MKPNIVQSNLQQNKAFSSATNSDVAELNDSADCPLLTIIIPAFNEASTLNEVLRRVFSLTIPKEIFVVDDGSTDTTRQLLTEWTGTTGIHVLNHSVNRGKGAAIRTALEFATGQFTIIQDGDLEMDPEQISHLIEPLIRGEADFVIGNRYADHKRNIVGRRVLMRMGIEVLNYVVRLLYGQRLSDMASCYKALATTNLRAMDLQCERFEFCPEVVAKACRLGFRFKEVPVSYRPRSSKEGKKLRIKDGIVAVRTLWRFRRWQPLKHETI